MSPEHKVTRRVFLVATASAGAVVTCGSGRGDTYEREDRRPAPNQDRSIPIRVFTPDESRIMAGKKALELGLDPIKFEQVGDCEGRWNQFAHNPSGASGLFQIMPRTWQNILDKFLPSKPYRNIWDAEDNIEAAATLWKKDGSWHWRQCGG